MAKTPAVARAMGRASESVATTIANLPAKVTKAIDAIRKDFTNYVKQYGLIQEKAAELAPKLMKAFGLWQAETGKSFVDFVRVLAEDVPADRQQYRNHPAYQRADYLRRLVGAGTAQRRARGTGEAGEAAASPSDAVVALVASLMTIVPEAQQERIWSAMQENLHWSERQVARLQTQVEHTNPLVELRGRVTNLRLVFPERTTEEAPADARTGTHG